MAITTLCIKLLATLPISQSKRLRPLIAIVRYGTSMRGHQTYHHHNNLLLRFRLHH